MVDRPRLAFVNEWHSDRGFVVVYSVDEDGHADILTQDPARKRFYNVKAMRTGTPIIIVGHGNPRWQTYGVQNEHECIVVMPDGHVGIVIFQPGEVNVNG
jgi:hypothetical protein